MGEEQRLNKVNVDAEEILGKLRTRTKRRIPHAARFQSKERNRKALTLMTAWLTWRLLWRAFKNPFFFVRRLVGSPSERAGI